MSGYAVSLTAVSKVFGSVRALDGLDVDLAAGAVHGLLGRSGAGKTTLLRILAGLDRAGDGSVTVAGAAPWENARVVEGICLVRENQVYPENWRVHHALAAAALVHPAWSASLADELVAAFPLPRQQRVKALSRGQRSMLGAVIGLASRAPLTLLDEPYLGLDAVARETLSARLVADHAAHPRTVVLSSHLVDEVADLLEHVVVLDRGQVVIDDTADALRGRAVTVSGPVALVEEFVAGGRELHREQLGRRLRVTLSRPATPVPVGLESAAVSLQELFVHTTSEEIR